MKKRQKKIKGYAAILGVMIIGTVALISSSFILFDAIDQSRLSLQSIQFEAAKYSATTCLEDTLIRMKQSEQFITNLDYQIDEDHSCQTTIAYGSEVAGSPPYYLVDLEITSNSFDTQRLFEYDLRVDNFDIYYNTGGQ